MESYFSPIRLTDVPYEWSCYSTVEEVQALLSCLSSQGIRESELKKALKEKLPEITEGIVKRLVWHEGHICLPFTHIIFCTYLLSWGFGQEIFGLRSLHKD